jgi:transcriptional regulator with XRE-family HTH domain
MDVAEEVTSAVIARAIGVELRLVREAAGWSREEFVAQLPSGIGARTLLSYEHGTRHMTVTRFLEICEGLGVAGPTLLTHALQRAQIHLANLTLRIDLRMVINHRNEEFRPMVQWARNKLQRHPDGVAELAPSAVPELADFVGCSHHDLAVFLSRFGPEPGTKTYDAVRLVTR